MDGLINTPDLSFLGSGDFLQPQGLDVLNPVSELRQGAAEVERVPLLIGNTRGNNIVLVEPRGGEVQGEFVAAGSGGLVAPDTILFGPDANGDGQLDLYVASGDRPGNSNEVGASSVLRYDGITGAFIDAFVGNDPATPEDETGGLFRPYGMTFGPDGNLYVSSFLSDQILRYNGETGEFIDVFAEGNAQAGGLNGPNGLLFAPDGSLLVTTQGSVAVDGQADFSAGLPSQVLRFDLESGESTVFASPTKPAEEGFGFISLLGLAISPSNGDLYVSDFANDVRRYDLETGALVDQIETNYSGTDPSGNFIGSLTFGPDHNLYVVGFDNRADSNNEGAVLRFSPEGDALPAGKDDGLVFTCPSKKLVRSIGITFFPQPLA